MNNRSLIAIIILLILSTGGFIYFVSQKTDPAGDVQTVDVATNKAAEETLPDGVLGLTKEEWENKLTPHQYYILWEKGTEKAFSGELLNNKEKRGLCYGRLQAPRFQFRE